MEKPKKAVAAGHVCLDITPIFPGGIRDKAENILLPGKLIHVEGADIHTGGSVANTGTAMKLLGADVRLAGMVGDDDFGKIVREKLKTWGADQDMIVSEKQIHPIPSCWPFRGWTGFFCMTRGRTMNLSARM